LIPAGTPIKVTGWGRHRAHVEIDGKPFRLGLDYGREAETIEKWVAKLIVAADPRAKLAEYSLAVRKAIEGGQVMVGMSREQVIMSLGHPLTSENPRLDAPFWRYWWSSFGEYQVHWAGERVAKVTGHPETLALMLAPGNAAGAAAPPSAAAPAAPAAPPAKTTPKATKGKSGGKPASPAAK
jgi:outer membrane protein assembly factor BamE (lipoprotein component of BamABCDE complex)